MQTMVSANSAAPSHWLELGGQVALGVRRERIPPCIDQIDNAEDWVMSGLELRFSFEDALDNSDNVIDPTREREKVANLFSERA